METERKKERERQREIVWEIQCEKEGDRDMFMYYILLYCMSISLLWQYCYSHANKAYLNLRERGRARERERDWMKRPPTCKQLWAWANYANENSSLGGRGKLEATTLQISPLPWQRSPCPQWWPFHWGIGKIFSRSWKWDGRCWGWLWAVPEGSRTLERFHLAPA